MLVEEWLEIYSGQPVHVCKCRYLIEVSSDSFLLLNYLIACLAFRFTEVFGVVLVRGTLMEFFCGYLAPVELLFGAALRWSPLSYLAGYPALLLMDCAAVPPSQAALVLLVWSLALGAVCAVVSRRSRVYFEGVGA